MFRGEDVTRTGSRHNVRRGMALIPSERFVFADLTVLDNLLLGGANQRDAVARRERMTMVYGLFPILKSRSSQLAGTLSGGEQRMLSLGLLLMARPCLLMLDEPSLGLAPMLVEEIFQIVQRLNREQKLTVLLVEQNATLALAIADHGYVMENGRIVLDGSADQLRDNADIKEFYLGLTEVGARKSYRDVKHYKRRKRWLS
jgi:branched-chain amino acid transport system ATP-binding protein